MAQLRHQGKTYERDFEDTSKHRHDSTVRSNDKTRLRGVHGEH